MNQMKANEMSVMRFTFICNFIDRNQYWKG